MFRLTSIAAVVMCLQHVLVADEAGRYQFLTETFGDDAIIVRYQANPGQIWFLNGLTQWQLIPTEEIAPRQSVQYGIVVFKSVVTFQGGPATGGFGVKEELNWTILRMVKQSGKSWRFRNGKFVPMVESDPESVPDQGSFGLVSARIGSSFAMYRFHHESGRIWTYKNNGWDLMKSDDLPNGDYRYLIAPYEDAQPKQDVEGAEGDVEFSLLRLDVATGKAWNWSVSKKRFEPISDQEE